MFAARTGWNLSPNRLTLRLERRRAAGLPIIDLTESNPTRCEFDYPATQILQAISRPDALAYDPHPRGVTAAREAVAAEYRARGVDVSTGNLVLTSGSSEAYSFLFRLLTDPGDRVLVPTPSYPLFDLLADINDVRLAPYPLLPEARFAIDTAALERAAGGAKALLVVSPGNPTGHFLGRSDRDAIIGICSTHGIPLICDEVFSDYAYAPDENRAASLAGESRLLTFTLNGLSKMLALPQLKLGWIAVSGPAAETTGALARLDLIADTFLSVNTPVQRGLAELLALRPGIQAQVMQRVRANMDYLRSATAAPHPCRCLSSEGGWNAILEVPRVRTEEEWALDLIDSCGLLVHPGYFFDFPGEGHLVVSLLPPAGQFRRGVDRLLEHLSSVA